MNSHQFQTAQRLVLQMKDKLAEQNQLIAELEKILNDQGPTCKPKGLKQKLCEILECYKCTDPL